jgi:hypothetical protein
MKKIETRSSTGGLKTEYFNAAGVRVRVTHAAGRAYSGKIAQAEEKKA